MSGNGRSRQDQAIQIVVKNEKTGSFELTSKVEELLQNDKVKDKKVCVISVAGAFRQGKSFLLNFFVKYLEYLEKACERVDDTTNWLDADKNESTGFAWQGGTKRKTTGIWAWNKVFILKKMGGSNTDTGQSDKSEEIAVILIDTQGTFDAETPTNDCTTIFALATLISSTLIFNLSRNIQENDLQYLQLFAEYGRQTQAMMRTTDKPFQSLMFLVRDWPNKCEYDYGIDGGRNFIEEKLAVSDGMHSDLTDVREGIQDCFSDIRCCLFPYPGPKIATYNKGCKLSDANEEFMNHVKKFVESISSVDNLIKRKTNGQEIKCGNLFQSLKLHVEAFEGGSIPPNTTLLKTAATVQHLSALDDAKTQFFEGVKEVCGADVPYMNPVELDHKLSDLKTHAESTFTEYRKIGSKSMNEKYLGELSNFMEETCREYTKTNENKANFLVKLLTGIMYPIVTTATLAKIKWYLHRGSMYISTFFEPIKKVGKLCYNTSTRITNSNSMPSLPYLNIKERIMNAIRIYLTLILIMVVFGLLSNFFGLLGLSEIATPLHCIFLAAFIILCLWIYLTLTGNQSTNTIASSFLQSSPATARANSLVAEARAAEHMEQATAEANNLAAVASAKDKYTKDMEQVCGDDKPYLSPDELEKNHNQTKEAAIIQFREVCKMGGTEYSQEYEDKLLTEMEESYEQYIKHNADKKARTPITLVIAILAMYILSKLFGLVGIYSLSNLADLMLGLAILLLCTWSYVRYSGQWVDVGTWIDAGTEFVWVHMYDPLYKYTIAKLKCYASRRD